MSSRRNAGTLSVAMHNLPRRQIAEKTQRRIAIAYMKMTFTRRCMCIHTRDNIPEIGIARYAYSDG
jgi:hypothetical protein